LIAHAHLEPFVAAQVISNPALATLILAVNPVAEKLALVGIALPLDGFPVLITAANAARIGRISVDGFGADTRS